MIESEVKFMAYTRHEWRCGDNITADLLNNIEDGVEEALDCCGYTCTGTKTPILEESVRTELSEGMPSPVGTLSSSIDGFDSIAVTFNGIEYIADVQEYGQYGAKLDRDTETFDWSEYPFAIGGDMLVTQNAGTYSVKIEECNETIETSDCFEKAFAKTLPKSFVRLGETSANGILFVRYEDENGEWKNLTPAILQKIFEDGKFPIVYYHNENAFESAGFNTYLDARLDNGTYKLKLSPTATFEYFSDSYTGGYYYAQ